MENNFEGGVKGLQEVHGQSVFYGNIGIRMNDNAISERIF